MVESARLESEGTPKEYPGFESLPLRKELSQQRREEFRKGYPGFCVTAGGGAASGAAERRRRIPASPLDIFYLTGIGYARGR